ncbi:MAG: hypothetical protein COV44_03490 [Deltaproteobacteria bacterium CG11_big_fil_rev_8_21_14_0_20_45_16]|nr:MAG: hypothetical protein COV44_03490 [Deltaproteobacteria bacterium CG11_big_fil_rev_8_21_14_0_20_45_16]
MQSSTNRVFFFRVILSNNQTVAEFIYRKKFDSSKKFSTWLYTIALNNLRDHLRSPHIKSKHDAFDENQRFETEEMSAEQSMISREDFEQVSRALQLLPEAQREIVILSDWEGFSSKEIRDILDLKDATVRQQLSRSRKFITDRLKESLT